ncbi:MAG: ABC transporter ATP-binding protein [Thermodesulfobacteriota bacterium]|nr:ABC transporter ATP-binding protein [Thermodesulfobacteriota bacterium]
MDGKKSTLEMVNVTKKFGGLQALNNVSVNIGEGEIRGIIGPNGAGKTTLFNAVTGELKVTSGKIYLAGENITGMHPHKICKKGLGRTFQLLHIFPEMSVYQSVWLGVNSKARYPWNPFVNAESFHGFSEETLEICRLVGLEEQINELAVNLSYGDQKVLEIAMALSTKPSVLLLDEPTQGVGPKESEMILNVVKKLSENTTIILIEHTIDFVMKLCNIVSVLNEGTLIAEGSPDEICSNKEVQRVYLGEEID